MAILVLFVAAAALNVFVSPSTIVAAAPFAVALLLAARRYPASTVYLFSVAAASLYLASGIIGDTSRARLLWDLAGILGIGFLAGLFAGERQALRQAQDRAVAAQSDLQRFLSLVAHDMSQPLTTILGYAQFLSRRGDPARTDTEQRALESIEAAAQRLRRLNDDLRDAGTVGTHHFSVERQETDLVQIVRQVVEQYRVANPAHTLELRVPEELPGRWDPDRLGQLFGNLIGNAIKYSPEEEPIRIDAYRVNGDVVVSVADSGVGMSQRDLERLFQPFSRLPGASGQGTGLGLFICKGIVDAHGGEIWVESQPNAGSTFSVRLPTFPDEPPQHHRTSRHPVRVHRRRRSQQLVTITPPAATPVAADNPIVEPRENAPSRL